MSKAGLPKVLFFERLEKRDGGIGIGGGARAYYRVIGRRAPKRGEWYVSGAIPQAYRMPNDAGPSFVMLIVEPTHYAGRTADVKGPPVRLPINR